MATPDVVSPMSRPEAAPGDESVTPDESQSLGDLLGVAAGVIIPFVGVVLAFLISYPALSPIQIILMAVSGILLYLISGFGITGGYHRLFTHRSFQVPIWLERVFAIAGCSAIEGPPIRWVAKHRKHHKFSDQPDDPHSPHHHGKGWRGMLLGLWHAHVGWLFANTDAPPEIYAKELFEDPFMLQLERLHWYLLIALLSLFGVPALLGFLIVGTAQGVLLGIVWIGLVRAFFLLQHTFSINSVCHIVGKRPFDTNDGSRNVKWLPGTLGESWHNNHHAFPYSYRHGLDGGLDLTAELILLLKKLGLGHNLRVASPERIEQKRSQTA